MIVRFDSKLTKSIADRRTLPIGVSGDSTVRKKGGVSEADKIVEEARANAMNSDVASANDENPMEDDKVKSTVIFSAVSEEPGPKVLTLNEAKNISEAADLNIQNKPNLNDGDIINPTVDASSKT